VTESANAQRFCLSAAAFSVAGILFALYPAIRPFSDEASLQGAAAFASAEWLIAHILAVVAFTLLPLGLLGLELAMQKAVSERQAYRAVVLSLIGVGLTLPFYGGEAYGLRAIGQEAIERESAALLSQAAIVRSGAGLGVFLMGLLLLAIATVMTAVAVWKSDQFSKYSGIPLAVGVGLYIPQFFWTQPLRVAHGVLVAIGCLWLAKGLWLQARRQ
jgi:hypothetical protein